MAAAVWSYRHSSALFYETGKLVFIQLKMCKHWTISTWRYNNAVSLLTHKGQGKGDTAITRDSFANHELNYMHSNPCTGVNLDKSPIDYLHSSALFFETGKQGIYEITNNNELDDINLTQ